MKTTPLQPPVLSLQLRWLCSKHAASCGKYNWLFFFSRCFKQSKTTVSWRRRHERMVAVPLHTQSSPTYTKLFLGQSPGPPPAGADRERCSSDRGSIVEYLTAALSPVMLCNSAVFTKNVSVWIYHALLESSLKHLNQNIELWHNIPCPYKRILRAFGLFNIIWKILHLAYHGEITLVIEVSSLEWFLV